MGVIFRNFIGFDMIIFILAVVTGLMYYFTKKSADELYDKMHLSVFVPGSRKAQREAEHEFSQIKESDVIKMRNRMGSLYSVFINLTGIFPLLGILGTVSSLLSLVQDMSDVQGSFYGALTSTFWGLVFAIGFKLADGFISSKIEDNEKTVALFLERNSAKDTDDSPADYY